MCVCACIYRCKYIYIYIYIRICILNLNIYVYDWYNLHIYSFIYTFIYIVSVSCIWSDFLGPIDFGPMNLHGQIVRCQQPGRQESPSNERSPSATAVCRLHKSTSSGWTEIVPHQPDLPVVIRIALFRIDGLPKKASPITMEQSGALHQPVSVVQFYIKKPQK